METEPTTSTLTAAPALTSLSLTDCAARLNALQRHVEAKKNEAIDLAGSAFGLMATQAEIVDQIESQVGSELDAWLAAHAPQVNAQQVRKARALYIQEDFRGLFALSGIVPQRIEESSTTQPRMIRDACVVSLGKLVSTFRSTDPQSWWGKLQEHERVTLKTQAPTLRALVALIQEDKPL